jgi:PST family polysaccharide transporter
MAQAGDDRGGASVTRDLDRALVSGVAWSAAAKWSGQIATWLATLLVARILGPSDYGVAGLAWLYHGLVGMVSEFGIGSAVVTLRKLSPRQVGQLRGLALVLAFVAALVTIVLALPLGRFFAEPRLPAVLLVLSVAPLVTSLKVVPSALLQRELQFRRLAQFETAGAAVSAASTLVLAYVGFGYWALVLGNLAGSATEVSLLTRARPQMPLRPRPAEIAEAIVFSREVLVARLSWYAYENADFLVAGKVLGAGPLGAYRMAWTFASMPLDKLVSLVNRVSPALLSAIQHDPAELRRYVLRITEMVSLIVIPSAVGLSLVAADLVRVLLGEKWASAVVPLQVLAAYATVRGLTPLWFQVLMITGDTRFSMRVATVAAVVMPLGFMVGSRWGVAGIALAWVFVHPPLVVAPVLRRVLIRIGLGFPQYLRVLAPAACAAGVMAIAVTAVASAMAFARPAWRLGTEVACGVAVYSAVVGGLQRARVGSLVAQLRAVTRKRA